MNRSNLSKVLAAVLSLALLISGVACSTSQTLNVVNQIASQLPVYLAAASNIATVSGDPQLAAVFQQISTIAQTDYPLLKAAIETYQANQTSGNLNALAAVVNQLATDVNVQILEANRIANPKGEAMALASINAFAIVVNGMAIALAGVNKNTSPVKTAQAIGFDGVKPYLSTAEVSRTAAVYGASPDFVAGL